MAALFAVKFDGGKFLSGGGREKRKKKYKKCLNKCCRFVVCVRA